jgi:hypothetical protein
MAHWHEPLRLIGGWGFGPAKGSRIRVAFHGEDVRVAPFEGHFLRYEGPEPPPGQRYPRLNQGPEGWVELWPVEPLLASSMQEAKVQFAPLLAQLERGDFAGFERRPYMLPVRPILVRQIDHPTHMARALIACRTDGIHQITYQGYAPNGRYFPASGPSIGEDLDLEWGVIWVQDRVGKPLRTLAADLESAEIVATAELAALVQANGDIKPR